MVDREESEFQAPPEPQYVAGMPEKAAQLDIEVLADKVDRRSLFGLRPPAPSIALAAARFTSSCAGGGAYANNCAHYLSNAFILAGYSDLPRSPAIRARCGSPDCSPPAGSGRPIRARNMHDWFRLKGAGSRRFFPKNSHAKFEKEMRNTGLWAVFELDESAYWGGHVCIVDTDTWKVYGTGMHGYWEWEQHCYKW